MAQQYENLQHIIDPVYDENSRILILGTFPSVKSRESQFFYGHPQNRFWKVLSQVLRDELPETIAEKKSFLLRNHIAIWDVIASCSIVGSSDSSIKDVAAADLSGILEQADVRGIYVNGGKAYDLYMKYTFKATGRPVVKLPSTSPANAAWTLERLVKEWGQIKDYLTKE